VRRSKITVFLALVFGLLSVQSIAQPVDTLQLGEAAFLKQVFLYHPAMRSMQLDVAKAEADVQSARAAFDPIWKTEYANKSFEGKPYYDYQHTAVEWQLPPGVGVKVGGERNRGDFINPELSTPADGLAFAEIRLPIGDGLLRTPEQTRLQQARLLGDRSLRDLESFQRDFITYAAQVYWNWTAVDRELELRIRISRLSYQRYEQTVRRFEEGLATAMDTLEAYNSFIKRETERLNTENMYQDWYRIVGTMVWNEDVFDEFRDGRVIPDSNWTSVPNERTLDVMGEGRSPLLHPALESLDLDRRIADLDFRLSRERIKPDIDLTAKAISTPNTINLSNNSAVVGISAKIPIISRKERAAIQKARIKQEQVDLKLSMKERELMQKFDQFEQQLRLTQEMLVIAEQAAQNSARLLYLENRRLLFGESTIFLINRRESSYLDAELKLIDVRRKLRILQWKLYMLTYSPDELLF
jgi:outer membrane protein TolC